MYIVVDINVVSTVAIIVHGTVGVVTDVQYIHVHVCHIT